MQKINTFILYTEYYCKMHLSTFYWTDDSWEGRRVLERCKHGNFNIVERGIKSGCTLKQAFLHIWGRPWCHGDHGWPSLEFPHALWLLPLCQSSDGSILHIADPVSKAEKTEDDTCYAMIDFKIVGHEVPENLHSFCKRHVCCPSWPEP